MGKRGHGEGTIYRRKDGRWAAEITIGYDAEGKRKYRTLYGRTRREVQRKLEEAKAELRAGVLVTDGGETLADWLRFWLKNYKKHKLRRTTWESYRDLIEVYVIPALGNVRLRDLRSSDLQLLYKKLFESGRRRSDGGLSARTVKYIHTILRSALERAAKERRIPFNPATAAELPEGPQAEVRTLTPKEVRDFLAAAAQHRFAAAFHLMVRLGLRRGEVLGLRWEDVNLENKTLHVRQELVKVKSGFIIQHPKTKTSVRDLPLPDDIAEMLAACRMAWESEREEAGPSWDGSWGLVFCTTTGKPILPRNFRRTYFSLLARAGVPPVRLHALRHTFSSLLAEAGVHPAVARDLMGHVENRVTDGYTHVRRALMADAVKRMSEYLSNVEPAESSTDLITVKLLSNHKNLRPPGASGALIFLVSHGGFEPPTP